MGARTPAAQPDSSRSLRDLAKRHEGRIALALLFLITIPMLTKIFTSDFGTHVALGRHIVESREISSPEFLNYTALGAHNANHEWGFQAILYLVMAAGGAYGVSAFLFLCVFGIFCCLYRSSLLRGAHPLLAVAAIFALSGYLRIRIQPRPEVFTYLFASMTILLFTSFFFREGRRKVVYLFPPLMFVWGNLHGSYLLGLILWATFLADSLWRAAWSGNLDREWIRETGLHAMVAGAAGFVAAGLNPLGYETLLAPLHLLSRGSGQSHSLLSISELTPLRMTGMYTYVVAAGALSGTFLLLGALGRGVHLLDLILLGGAFKASWGSARAVSLITLFLAMGLSVQVTGFLSRSREWLERKSSQGGKKRVGNPPGGHIPQARRKTKKEEKPAVTAESPGSRWARLALPVAIAAGFLVFGAWNLHFSMKQLEFGAGMTEHKFSFKAAEFLRKNPVPGNMFNFFDIGGFLDWQLYPVPRTFIDGRAINQQVFLDHQNVTGALPHWEDVLRKYGVTHIVTKTIDSSGMILPLIPALWDHPDWRLVFADGLFVIFVRSLPETEGYVREHAIPKAGLPQQIIWEAYHYTFLGISPAVAYNTMSSMYLVMGNRAAALQLLRDAVRETGDPFLRSRLLSLEAGRH